MNKGWGRSGFWTLLKAVGRIRFCREEGLITLGSLMLALTLPCRAELAGMGAIPRNVSAVRLGKVALSRNLGALELRWTMDAEWGVVGYEAYLLESDRWIPISPALVVAHQRSDHSAYVVTQLEAPVGDQFLFRLLAHLKSGDSVEVTRQSLSASAPLEANKSLLIPPSKGPSRPQVSSSVVGSTVPVDLTHGTAMVKILTSVQGLHFVSAASLATALGQSDPTVVSNWLTQGNVALFNGGFDSAHRVDYIPGNGYGTGGTVPGLFFYAQQIWNNYTTTNAYWLLAGTNQYTTVNGGSPAPTTPGAYTASWSAESDIDNGLSLVTASPGTPQGMVSDQSFWFWKQLTASSGNDTWTTSFPLDHLVRTTGKTATLTIKLYGSTQTAQTMTVKLNGTVLDSYVQGGGLSGSGIGARQAQFTFPMSLLKDNGTSPSEGKNALSVQALLPTGTFVSQFYLDSYQLSYQRTYAISSPFTPAIEAPANGLDTQTITVSGYGGATQPTILGFDVTDALHPHKLVGVSVNGSSGAWSASLNPATPTNRFVVINPAIAGAQAIPSASALSVVYPPHLDESSTRASYLIVTSSGFTNSANTLAAYRSASFRTKVVVLDDIYNQFSFGVATPHALEAFISSAYTNWSIPPRYLALVGDGSYDYRDLTASHDNFLPPLILATPYGGFASDSHYGKVTGDGLPRIIVGRFPIRSDAEFNIMLNKIKAYESESVTNLKSLLLADQSDSAGDFIANRNEVKTVLGTRYTDTLLDPGYTPPVTSAGATAIQSGVQASLNGGVDIFNYIGHGAQDQLGVEPYVQVSTQSPVSLLPALNNSSRLPILVAMTCVAGDFAEPGFTSLAEALLRVNNSGAVAVVAPTGLSQDKDATQMNLTLMSLLGANLHGRFGDLVGQAFSQYATTPLPNASTTFWIYNILGDPALLVTSTAHP